MKRREFISRSGLLLGTLPLAGSARPLRAAPTAAPDADPGSWSWVRDQFALSRERIHMASFLLASHPRAVAEAVERHRRAFDADPVHHWHEHFLTAEPEQRAAAAEYLGVEAAEVALTDSTTMGLGLVYATLRIGAGQEILTTTHDHYATELALRHRADRTGSSIRSIALYDDPATASVEGIVERIRRAMTPSTRVLAITWVHSSTGVKLPVAAIAAVVREANAGRDERDRVLLCVDGVHGLGIEDVTMDELGCDVFVAGTHKWLFGPRGTGIVWARRGAWDAMQPVIPGFGADYGVWLGFVPPEAVEPGDRFSPGGFHSFEHRWALGEAFRFHRQIGKARVQERIHTLNAMTRDALAAMPHVRLHTPRAAELCAGMVCFDVDGMRPEEVERRLLARGIVASTTPYRESHARLAPSLINDEAEVERTVAEIAAMR